MLSRSLALLITAVSASACYGAGFSATAGTPVETTSATVDADVGPGDVDMQAALQVEYEGRPTYYYRDHWYYRDGNRWQYYRSEPNVLLEQRRRFQVNRGNVNVAPRRDEERRDFDKEKQNEHEHDRGHERDRDRDRH